MSGFWRLLARIRNYRRQFFLSVASNILLSIFTVVSIPVLIPFFQILFGRVSPSPVPPEGKDINDWAMYYMSGLIDNYGRDKALLAVCILVIVVFFFKNLFRYLALYFMAPLRYGIIYDLRKELYARFLDLPLGFYTNERKGVLLSSMTMDVMEVEWSVLNVIEAIFKTPVIMAGSIFFMIYISPSLTLFVSVLVIFAGLIIGKIINSLKKSSQDVQETVAELTAHVEESLGGVRIIRGFNAGEYQSRKFDQENNSYRSMVTRVVNRRDAASPLSEFLGVSVVAILMWYGSRLVFKEQLAPETFFAFVFAFYQLIEPAKSFSSAWFNIQKGLAALDRIERITNTPNDVKSPVKPKRLESFSDEIRFENVSFRYQEGASNALENINVSIKKGSVVALVGSSGAGKSTFVDLLPRFYDPAEGRITIDGTDIRDADLEDLRGLFGIVSQDPVLFHDSIANNISFGAIKYSRREIEEAARIANAHDFIRVLPEGYDTNIGDRGLKLSGGQRQRLTIARAVLRNPPVLILDEATSALDSESEKLVQDALHKLMENRTSVVVAHRLSTIQNADLILVLDHGRIIQAGTPSDLMAQDGPYRKFVEMQSFA
jgi:subfamily B ATP-binding cassette protein MsbA